MASIYLVRHGQASFGKLNYDQLSPLGYQQGERVGHFLQEQNIIAGKVIVGNMARHRQTMSSAQSIWHSFGETKTLEGFNEFDSDDVITCAFPKYNNKALLAAHLAKAKLAGKDSKKVFQEMFAQAVTRWTDGKHDADYIESWSHFCTRVEHALLDAISIAEGKDIVIFTSGGPITAVCKHLLGLGNDQAFDLNWTIVNASITHLLYNSSGKISLASFNEKHHLHQAGKHYLSYR